MAKPIPIRSAPGIKRDGTQFEGDNYVDGAWSRFQRGLPRKMGGYRAITSSLPELIHGMTVFSANMTQYLHGGSDSFLHQIRVNAGGSFGGTSNRTPAGFVSGSSLWQFDVFWDGAGSEENMLIAHAPPNLASIDSETEASIYLGPVTGTGALTASGMDPQSGGVLVLAPYLLTFGNSGRVDISNIGDPNSVLLSAFVTGSKIVKGLPVRGGSGPSGLLWSLDSLILATFTSTATGTFGFNTLSASSSVLSSQGIIEYDGVYYWAGAGRFLMFNGVLREVPNAMNLNWFFDNLNYEQRQKVFAYTVPRFGEIWWCFPFGSATECTHAVIYNVRENTWYDTELPNNNGRSAGVFASVYNHPFLTDTEPTDTGYTVWQHETGRNELRGSLSIAVPSYFETGDISMLTAQEAADKSLRVARIEPDFVQSGPMTVQVRGRANARAEDQPGEIFEFPEVATQASEETVPVKEVRRLMRFRFGSNVVDGNYQTGLSLAHIEPADGRVTK